jgi:hypothetical protein
LGLYALGVIQVVAVSVKALGVGGVGHYGIRADKPPNIDGILRDNKANLKALYQIAAISV